MAIQLHQVELVLVALTTLLARAVLELRANQRPVLLDVLLHLLLLRAPKGPAQETCYSAKRDLLL